ncbi:MAG: hypothetical protein JXR05_00070 [Flavobacteriaceae bacterium]
MKYKLTTYKTLTGNKEILELTENAYVQWIIYESKKPMFHINCFDFENESNQILNGLLLVKQQPIDQILKNINKKKNTNLSIEKAPLIEIEVASKITELNLESLPLEWVN